MQQTGGKTLIDAARWPRERSTNDLDLLLRAEVVADKNRFDAIADALDRLGYVAVPGAEYMQFIRTIRVGDREHEVKVDLLVGAVRAVPAPVAGETSARPPERRQEGPAARPRHAGGSRRRGRAARHPRSRGRARRAKSTEAQVCLPQAFPYAMMKLFAFRDRKDDPDPRKDKGRHHALDLYAIVAMMTEPEYDFATPGTRPVRREREGGARPRRSSVSDFAGPESIGVLRLREHVLYNPAMDLDTFLSVLREIFA